MCSLNDSVPYLAHTQSQCTMHQNFKLNLWRGCALSSFWLGERGMDVSGEGFFRLFLEDEDFSLKTHDLPLGLLNARQQSILGNQDQCLARMISFL